MSQLISYSSERGVCSISIQRAEVKNALNVAAVRELTASFKRAELDRAVRVVVLRGAGSEAFCSGADLRELAAATSRAEREAFFGGVATLVEQIGSMRKPVIAMVHGFALAGGCGIAAAADITLAADDAVFGIPEIHIGLVPMIVMAPIERAIGRKATAYLALTGHKIDATEALRIGLVSRVFPKATLEAETARIAESLASKSMVVLGAAKEALYEIPEKPYLQLLKELPQKIADLSLSEDSREGIEAFLAKRKPQWN